MNKLSSTMLSGISTFSYSDSVNSKLSKLDEIKLLALARLNLWSVDSGCCSLSILNSFSSTSYSFGSL